MKVSSGERKAITTGPYTTKRTTKRSSFGISSSMSDSNVSQGRELAADEALYEGSEATDITNSDESFSEDATTSATPVSSRASPRRPACRQKNLACPYPDCDKAFNRPANLEQHKRSHTNERIFKCQEFGCSKDFLKSDHLKRHIQLEHSEQRDYLCDWDNCDKSFGTAQHLKRHYAAHQGREKHKCNEAGCGQSFRKPHTLERHQRTVHAGLPAYPCDQVLPDGTICPRGFDTFA